MRYIQSTLPSPVLALLNTHLLRHPLHIRHPLQPHPLRPQERRLRHTNTPIAITPALSAPIALPRTIRSPVLDRLAPYIAPLTWTLRQYW